MTTTTRASLLGRVPARVRTALAWTGFALSPFVLQGWLVGGYGNVGPAIRFASPVLAMLMLIGVLRRRPLAVLGLLLVDLATLDPVVGPRLDRLPAYVGDLRLIQVAALDLVVCYLAGTRRRGVSVPAAVAAFLVQVGVAAAFRISQHDDLVTTAAAQLLALVTAWVVGDSLRQRRAFAEAQRAQAAQRAIEAERLRIARDVHDLVAHSIGVIAIQAGMGRRVIDTQPGEARTALAVIEESSRDTLAALRRMLGSLRRTDPVEAPRDPAPGLGDLERLVARTRDAGVEMTVVSTGDGRAVPPDIDLAAYRIVQEAVTNVIRHAGTGRCTVRVDRGDVLTVEVSDDGRGGTPGAGYGIPGMRERAVLLGGSFEAGPRPGRGFLVRARLPLPADAGISSGKELS
ncbi:sensor histidine kinase [Dactylosporangium sp. NPDC000555]|uniref:sensor histidine kinase n=1 Tax=Dactylosporangium sp. NPDC000555 TaxID=3154260 RepID=UPI003321DE6C